MARIAQVGGLLVAASVAACDRDERGADASVAEAGPRAPEWPEAAPWPSFPTDEPAAQRLLAAQRSAEAVAVPALAAPTLIAHVRVAVRDGTAVSGEDAIGAWIRDRLAAPRDVYVLFGVFHDGAAQLDWVRRLVGPVHQDQAIAIATELFRADGHWADVPAGEQHGDDEPLARYRDAGDRRAFATLLEGQRAGNYTAWKYGYLPGVLDLVQQARASGGTVLGCDTPSSLGDRLARLDEATRLRIRELHCVLHLRDAALPHPLRVALIWGDDHLGADGLRRVLPATADVWGLHVVGGRASETGIETDVAAAVRITDPLLVPLGAHDHALLLPEAALGARVDRRRDDLDAPLEDAARGQVNWLADAAGRLSFATGVAAVTAGEPTTFRLAPGDHAVLWESGADSIVVTVHMPPDGAVEVDVGDGVIATLERRP